MPESTMATLWGGGLSYRHYKPDVELCGFATINCGHVEELHGHYMGATEGMVDHSCGHAAWIL